MLLLIGISSESLGLEYLYGSHYEAEKARNFYNEIISFLKGDFTQCILSPHVMAFGKLEWTDQHPKEAKTKKILVFVWIIVVIVVLQVLCVSCSFQITLSLSCGLWLNKARRACNGHWALGTLFFIDIIELEFR